MAVAFKTIGRASTLAGSLLFAVSLLATPAPHFQEQQPAPDNSKTNRDHTSNPTADQQKMNTSDREITRKIRKAIHDDESLSTYAHNIKIISQDGKVTLRGPVKSDQDKSSIEAKAAAVVGQDNVTSQIEVAPSK
jgi:osmotically-inducible protein OsmY